MGKLMNIIWLGENKIVGAGRIAKNVDMVLRNLSQFVM